MLNLPDATKLGSYLSEHLKEAFDCVEIVGSVRRLKTTGIKDVDLICLPVQMLNPVHQKQIIEKLCLSLVEKGILSRGKSSGDIYKQFVICDSTLEKLGIKKYQQEIRWSQVGTGRKTRDVSQVHLVESVDDAEVHLELCIAKPDNYGYIQVIRTGSDDFTRSLFTPISNEDGLKTNNYVCKNGFIANRGITIPIPDEQTFFKLWNFHHLPYFEGTDLVPYPPTRNVSMAAYWREQFLSRKNTDRRAA